MDDLTANDDGDMAAARAVIEAHTLDELRAKLIYGAKDIKGSTLKTKLTDMWSTYLQNSRTTSVTDFLSVQHLGFIFQQLAELGKSQISGRIDAVMLYIPVVETSRV